MRELFSFLGFIACGEPWPSAVMPGAPGLIRRPVQLPRVPATATDIHRGA